LLARQFDNLGLFVYLPIVSAALAPSDTATRDRILDAAQRRYLRFGVRKTTMDEIAREAGCARATVYLHFQGKDALYAELLRREADSFHRQVVTALRTEPDARHQLRRMVEITRETYARNDILRLAMAGDEEMTLRGVAQTVMQEQEETFLQLLHRVLENGVIQGSLRALDPARVAYLMYHLGNFLLVRETTGRGDYEFGVILAVMDDVFNRGIAQPKLEATDAP